jgi:hypothetical protein
LTKGCGNAEYSVGILGDKSVHLTIGFAIDSYDIKSATLMFCSKRKKCEDEINMKPSKPEIL